MSTFNKQDPEEDEHGYNNLCKYSIQKCELCDMVFSSRFANIIHSSQHIIIPLIKQKVHKCKKCLFCFTLKSDLKAHKQIKHKKKDINEDNYGQIDHVESQNGQEVRQNGQEWSELGHQEVNTDHKKITASSKKSQNSPDKSHISCNGSQSNHKESQKTYNKSENEADALLRSIITNQPIVKIDNIAHLVAKTLLATKNDEKHTKLEKNTSILTKDILKKPKEKKNKEKNDAKTQKDMKIETEKVKAPPPECFSRPQTSQIDITVKLSNKIIIGGKKTMKRTSPDKIDHKTSKINKNTTSTVTNKHEKDANNKTKVTNGVHTEHSIEEQTNRHSFNYREISPGVISIKSDSSDEPNDSEVTTLSTAKSKRSLFAFSHDEEELSLEKDQSKTVQQKDQSKSSPPNDQSKTKGRKQSINIPFVITGSDSELDANIDELLLLNNVSSPVKKSNFRSKIQFEDDENIQVLDMERELTGLCYEFKSVHYDKLIEKDMSECKRCHMIFMNRLALHKHEMTHIRFKRTKKHYFCKYCENYYAGNHFTQKKHYEQIHNASVDKKKVFSCPVCKLQYYKLKEHYKKYHPNLICNNCSTCFGTEQVFQKHNCSKTIETKNLFVDSKNTQKNYDLLLVCELCLSFTKTTGNFKYEVVGEKCEIGSRQRCFYCTKEFFEVKIVKRVNFMTSIRSQNMKNNEGKAGEGKKMAQGSNAKKLHMIRKRLKAMKK